MLSVLPRRFTARIALLAVASAILGLVYRLVLVQPSNQRNWEVGMGTLAHISIEGDMVRLQHVRDFRWGADGPLSSVYVDRHVDVQQLERVWFVEEPFKIPQLPFFDGVAHTYFVFDFRDQPPIVLSVEARRERGETYNVFSGLFNAYELIYIWGTELDETGRRVAVEHNQLYMYPLQGSLESGRSLFLHLARTAQALETQPRFYNSLTTNCTNELAKVANEAQPGAIPLNIGLIAPGYAVNELYALGFVPNHAPLAEIKQRYAISDTVAAIIDDPDFSVRLRQHLGVTN